ncbi:MAG: ATP-binding cassette domain-containing protein [Vallitaleaceae bacterium]|nr:ATP-binding cassette domain-containing protein [Vallitaleaceae bacterium]
MALDMNITKKLGEFQLQVKTETKGNCHGILGPSGCGKSLTLKCIAGIEKPDSGSIHLNGKVLFDSEQKVNQKVQKRKVGYLFQNYALFPHMSVEENIAVGLHLLPKKEQKERVAMEIKHFHLKGLEKRYPRDLSGGQQQRVALARLFAYQPEILLLDEPFSALDSYLKDLLQEELLTTLNDFAKDVLLVTHSKEEAFKFCTSLSILHKGKVISEGSTHDIFHHPTSINAAKFLGCKNFSRIKRIHDYLLEALDWGIRLETTQKITDEIRFVGCFHHAFLEPITPNSSHNKFPVQILSFYESFDQFHYTLVNPQNPSPHKIYWSRNKNELTTSTPILSDDFLYLPKESLLLLQ